MVSGAGILLLCELSVIDGLSGSLTWGFFVARTSWPLFLSLVTYFYFDEALEVDATEVSFFEAASGFSGSIRACFCCEVELTLFFMLSSFLVGAASFFYSET